MADQKKVVTPLIYLKQELSLPGETLGRFSAQWKELSQADKNDLMESARKEMDDQS